MKQYEALSYCGIYCRGCRNYKENMNCMGCRQEENLVNDCPTRACTINRGFLHCGECADFPCGELSDFYNDGKPHHGVAYKNILRLKEVGTEKWLLEQEKEHTCECGRRKLWFATECTHGDNQQE